MLYNMSSMTPCVVSFSTSITCRICWHSVCPARCAKSSAVQPSPFTARQSAPKTNKVLNKWALEFRIQGW